MTKAKIKFITLGCKVNQYETQGMREALRKAGASSLAHADAEEADVVIVNTCTVTSDADKENRYWIRRAKRENPNARIIVTGCGVEKNRQDYERLPEVSSILLNHEKAVIAERLFEGCATDRVQESVVTPYVNPRHRYTPLAISETEGFGRAFVKIQDGCNHSCSFCKVVIVRGRSRSRSLQEIIEEVVRLRDAGYREIVFAGIQLGAYGLDFVKSERSRLIEVLEACSAIEGIERLRLSSIEPTDVKPSLIKAMSQIEKCCHQLHIPLQSGDSDILKNMNRRYSREFYIDLIARLRSVMPDFCLSMDVMAGFPGETEENFQNTMDLLRTVKPVKSHVFPYSRREGTRAAQLPDLAPEIVKNRVKALMELGETLSREVRGEWIGKKTVMLAEGYNAETGFLNGLTQNYLKVYVEGSAEQVGQMVSVEMTALHSDGLLGKQD